jgi:hypothetical protein
VYKRGVVSAGGRDAVDGGDALAGDVGHLRRSAVDVVDGRARREHHRPATRTLELGYPLDHRGLVDLMGSGENVLAVDQGDEHMTVRHVDQRGHDLLGVRSEHRRHLDGAAGAGASFG